MPQALPLQDKVSQTASSSTTYRLNVAQFGDGYSQRTPDGINYIQRKWTISYDNLSVTDYTTVSTFVDTVGNGQYFTWQPPGIASSLKWILDGAVTMTPKSGNLYSVSFGIRQVYDLT